MTIKVLDGATIRNLHSGQVIVDIEAIVKELIENSLDAHATSIELVFTNNGLETLQVKDDGDGIEEADRSCAAKQHCTSKIKQFNDLESIETFGFRGEAMNSICNLSDKLIIITKTKQDIIAKQYDVDKEGNISNEKPVNAIPKSGTIIQLEKPFYHLPVRRQLAQKNAAANMKKIQDLLIKYALAHPHVRFSSQQKSDTAGGTIRNNNNSIWIKPMTSSVTSTVGILFGAQLNDMLERFIETDPQYDDLTIDVILPNSNSDPSIILKGPDRLYFYVNQRPINYVKSELKELVSTIRTRYYESIGLQNNNKKPPFMYIDIQLPPSQYDVNVEPNKTTILFHNKQRIVSLIETVLDRLYPSKSNQFFSSSTNTAADAIARNNDDSVRPTQNTIPGDKSSSHPVNVAQQSEEEPLFMQNSPIIPTEQPQLQQKEKTWALSMMDDEFDELVSDDDSSVIAKSSNKAASTTSNRSKVGVTQQKKATLPQQQQSTSLEQALFTTPPTTKQPVTAAASKTIPPAAAAGLEGWQIDDCASTIIGTAATADLKPPTATNAVSPIHTNHVSTLSATNNQPKTRTINDALQFDRSSSLHSLPLTTKPALNTEKLIPKKRTIQVDDHDVVTVSRTTLPKVQKQHGHQIAAPSISSQNNSSPPRQTLPLIHGSPTPSRRRDIPSLFNMSSSQRKKPNGTNPTNTLNQAIRIDCSFEDDIMAKYPIRKEILGETYRIRISDYLQVNDYQKGQITSLLKDSTGGIGEKGLAFYTRGNPSTFDKCRHQILELGVVQLKQLTIESITNRLARDYKMVVKKLFDRPVQIQLSHQDRLCPILISLKSKEQFISDDMHGCQSITYREIIDDKILFNGFRARWRKDLVSGNLIVQFTGIYSLGSGYGTCDFRELLSLIAEAAAKSAIEKVSGAGQGPSGSVVRPTKAMHHLRRLAEEMYESKKQDDEELKELERALDELKWKEDQKGSDWKLGYASNSPNKVLACLLASSSTLQN